MRLQYEISAGRLGHRPNSLRSFPTQRSQSISKLIYSPGNTLKFSEADTAPAATMIRYKFRIPIRSDGDRGQFFEKHGHLPGSSLSLLSRAFDSGGYFQGKLGFFDPPGRLWWSTLHKERIFLRVCSRGRVVTLCNSSIRFV